MSEHPSLAAEEIDEAHSVEHFCESLVSEHPNFSIEELVALCEHEVQKKGIRKINERAKELLKVDAVRGLKHKIAQCHSHAERVRLEYLHRESYAIAKSLLEGFKGGSLGSLLRRQSKYVKYIVIFELISADPNSSLDDLLQHEYDNYSILEIVIATGSSFPDLAILRRVVDPNLRNRLLKAELMASRKNAQRILDSGAAESLEDSENAGDHMVLRARIQEIDSHLTLVEAGIIPVDRISESDDDDSSADS